MDSLNNSNDLAICLEYQAKCKNKINLTNIFSILNIKSIDPTYSFLSI